MPIYLSASNSGLPLDAAGRLRINVAPDSVISGSSTVANGLTLESAGALRSVLEGAIGGAFVTFQGGAPLNATGAAGDWARLAALWTQYSGKAAIVLEPGVIRVDSKQVIPNLSTIIGQTGVKLVQTLANDGDVMSAAFAAQIGAVTLATTLAAAAKRGDRSIVTVAAPGFPVGGILQISNAASAGNSAGFRVSRANIAQVAGVNINLDRTLPRDYAAGDNVVLVASVPEKILILGGGMTITGTGVRYVELLGARLSMVRDIIVDDSQGIASDILFSFDGGSYDSLFENIKINVATSATTPLAGIALESCDGCCVDLSAVYNQCSYGVVLYDCSDCHVTRTRTLYCPAVGAAGIALGSDTAVRNATTQGCISCTIDKCTMQACNQGALIRDGSRDNRITNSSADGNAIGVAVGVIGGDTTIVQANQIDNTTTRRNTTYGLATGTLSQGTQARGVDFGDNGATAATGTGILAQGDLSISDARSASGNGLHLILATGGILRVAGLTAVHTQVVDVIALGGTTRTDITGLDLTCAGGANAINSIDPLYIDRSRITGAAFGLVAGTNPTWVGFGVDTSGCATDFLLNAGGQVYVQPTGGESIQNLAAANAALRMADMQRGVVRAQGNPGAGRTLTILKILGAVVPVANEFSTAQTVTVQAASGAAIVIAQGKTEFVRWDGTNTVAASTPDP